MDPVLPSIVQSLIPVLAVLAVFGGPIGFLWIIKNHQYRMKELELESQRTPPRVEERLSAIEARLAAIEAAVKPQPVRSALQERAELLEGPPLPDAAKVRQS